jgi:hypothetical protein
MAEIFHIDIPTHGPGFEEISRIAAEKRQTQTDEGLPDPPDRDAADHEADREA